MRRCPYCAEDIADDTTRCPHCGSDLTTPAGATAASAPGWGTPAPSPSPTPAASSTQFSHTGQRYLLGYDAADFGIWDRSAPNAPVERFPRSDEGWSQAWQRYSSLEPNSQPVQAAPGPAGYGAQPAPSGYAAPVGAAYGAAPSTVPWQQGQPAYYVPQRRRQNGMAVAALVLGIVGLIFFALFAIPPLLALIFGLVARNQIAQSQGTQEGGGLAIAGIVLGSVGLVFFVIWLIAVVSDQTPGF